MLSEDAVIVLIFVIDSGSSFATTCIPICPRDRTILEFSRREITNDWHAGYLLYVKGFLQDTGLRHKEQGQYYHPPFHYFVDAVL